MTKINLRTEKIEKNEAYALRYKKEDNEDELKEKKEIKAQGGKWGKWCRVDGHLPSCSCQYPDPSELYARARR